MVVLVRINVGMRMSQLGDAHSLAGEGKYLGFGRGTRGLDVSSFELDDQGGHLMAPWKRKEGQGEIFRDVCGEINV